MSRINITYILIGIISMSGLVSAAVNYSEYFPNGSAVLQSQSNGWATPVSSSKEIMTPEGCRNITSSQGTQIFVPTKNLSEWNSFKNSGVVGITIGFCTPSGIVTGLYTWSNEYLWITYSDAVSTCAALTPNGIWRVPSGSEIDVGRSVNGGLFSGNKFYWTSLTSSFTNTIGDYYNNTWMPTYNSYTWCTQTWTSCNGAYPNGLRCVTDS